MKRVVIDREPTREPGHHLPAPDIVCPAIGCSALWPYFDPFKRDHLEVIIYQCRLCGCRWHYEEVPDESATDS